MPSRPSVMSRAALRASACLEQALGADPGLLRLRFALRITCMVTLAALGLVALHRWAALPVPAAALGFLVVQFGGAAVRDPTPRAQAATTLLLGVPALAGAALAALLAPWQWASALGFLLMVFIATLASGGGARLTACGMLGFVGFYVGELLQIKPAQLLYGVGAVAFATLVALLVRLVLLPERPAGVLPRLVRSVEREAAHLLDDARRVMAAPADGGGLTRRRARLQEAVLATEKQIQQLRGAEGAGVSRLAVQLLDLQLGAVRVARRCTELARQGTVGPDLRHRFDPLIRRLGLAPGRLPPASGPAAPDPTAVNEALDQLSGTVRELPQGRAAILAAARASLPAEEKDSPAARAASWGEEEGEWLGSNWRQAIQATVACAVAILLGQLLSGRRWYWSVLAAFIVFAGTGPRTVTLTKATQRIIGTLLGIGAGLGIGLLVQGQPLLILPLALLSDFLAFYAFQTAYSVMIFWVTIMLALLYALLGMFRPELLEIRLWETVIGAAAGMVVAALLLPRRTRDALHAAALDFLHALCAALTLRPWEAPDPGAAAHAWASPVRRGVQDLRAAAGPLNRGWARATPVAMRRVVQAAMDCSDLLQEWLALRRRAPPPVGAGAEAALRAELAEIIQALEAGAPLPDRPPSHGAPDGEEAAVLAALSQAIRRLAAALDAAARGAGQGAPGSRRGAQAERVGSAPGPRGGHRSR